jgi:hypothetical protein
MLLNGVVLFLPSAKSTSIQPLRLQDRMEAEARPGSRDWRFPM